MPRFLPPFDEIDLLLNKETSRYIFRILAVKEIMSNPDLYGFIYEESDLYRHIPIRKIGIDIPIINIAQFAKKNNIGMWSMKFEYPWDWRKKN